MKKWRLVTYDVRDPKRLRRVAKILEGHGARIQYSVFRVHATDRELEKMRWKLARVVQPEDSILYIHLCNACAARATAQDGRKSWPDEPETLKIL